jgi:flagellin
MMGQRSLRKTIKEKEHSSMKLSSGDRIYTAATDPAGLAIAEKLRAKSAGLSQAKRNANDTISLLQIAEGNLSVVHGISTRLKELAVQAANDTLTTLDRFGIQQELAQLYLEIQRIASTTQFNTRPLLNGNANLTFHVGPNANITINVKISNMLPANIGIASSDIRVAVDNTAEEVINMSQPSSGNPLNLTTQQQNAENLISVVEDAINRVTSERTKLGGFQNRLEHTISNLMNYEENLMAAESRIRDTDYAAEMTKFVKYQILSQVALAMLAQANIRPQMALQLLG